MSSIDIRLIGITDLDTDCIVNADYEMDIIFAVLDQRILELGMQLGF